MGNNFEELWAKYKEEDDKRNSKSGMYAIGAEGSPPPAAETNIPEGMKLVQDDYEYRRAQSFVLGHPDSFDRVRCWMVDVHGSCACNELPEMTEKDIQDVVESASQGNHNYIDKHGPIAQNIRKVMSKFRLTDSGGGDSGWHLGCHCTEAEARNLIYKLQIEFGKAIKAGLITIDRHFWSLELKDEE